MLAPVVMSAVQFVVAPQTVEVLQAARFASSSPPLIETLFHAIVVFQGSVVPAYVVLGAKLPESQGDPTGWLGSIAWARASAAGTLIAPAPCTSGSGATPAKPTGVAVYCRSALMALGVSAGASGWAARLASITSATTPLVTAVAWLVPFRRMCVASTCTDGYVV